VLPTQDVQSVERKDTFHVVVVTDRVQLSMIYLIYSNDNINECYMFVAIEHRFVQNVRVRL
jgi:hypothetical protein